MRALLWWFLSDFKSLGFFPVSTCSTNYIDSTTLAYKNVMTESMCNLLLTQLPLQISLALYIKTIKHCTIVWL